MEVIYYKQYVIGALWIDGSSSRDKYGYGWGRLWFFAAYHQNQYRERQLNIRDIYGDGLLGLVEK